MESPRRYYSSILDCPHKRVSSAVWILQPEQSICKPNLDAEVRVRQVFGTQLETLFHTQLTLINVKSYYS
jgi:hypothetical protein